MSQNWAASKLSLSSRLAWAGAVPRGGSRGRSKQACGGRARNGGSSEWQMGGWEVGEMCPGLERLTEAFT